MPIHLMSPWMLLVALAPLGVLVVLYLLKMKRQELEISAVFLWRKSIDDMRANAPLQRLRMNVLFWLQLAALAALGLALARPIGQKTLVKGRTRIIVVDRSASMGTVEDGRTRLERAAAEAARLVGRLSAGDQVALVTFAETAETDVAPTTDRFEVRRALEGLEATALGTRLGPALKIAVGAARSAPNAEIHVFSDGAAPDAGEIDVRALSAGGGGLPPITFHKIGKATQNAGFSAVSVRRRPSDETRVEVFCTVRNFGDAPFIGEISLYLDGGREPADIVPVELAAGAEDSRVFALSVAEEARVRLRLTPEDGLVVDNTAFVAVRRPAPRRLLLVTKGNLFLERLAAATPDFVVTTMRPKDLPKEGEKLSALFDGYGAVILDRFCPVNLPFGRYLMFDVAPPLPGWKAGAPAEGRAVLDWNATHPVMRFVGLRDLYLGGSRALEAPEGAVGLIETSEGPVAMAYADGRQRMVVVGCDLYKTNWPLLRSFPVFVTNACGWLSGPSGGEVPMAARTGARVPLPVPPGAAVGEVTVTRPDGKEMRVAGEGGRAPALPALEMAGFYSVRVAGRRAVSVGVNLARPAESDIRPRERLALGEGAGVSASGPVEAPRRYWPWLAAAALAVLAVEWVVYARRVRLE